MRTGNIFPTITTALLLALGACGEEPEPVPEATPAAEPVATVTTPTGEAGPALPPPQPQVPPGAAEAAGAPPGGASAQLVQQGQQIFNGQVAGGICFTCHGPNGQGGPLAPNLADSQWLWFQNKPQLDEVVTLIKTGITEPKEYPAPMPAMGGTPLTDEQLRAVAAYVLSLQG